MYTNSNEYLHKITLIQTNIALPVSSPLHNNPLSGLKKNNKQAVLKISSLNFLNSFTSNSIKGSRHIFLFTAR